MTIIQNLIKHNYSHNQQFNQLIIAGMQLPEIDQYLKNLDKQALLIEHGDLSSSDIQLQSNITKHNHQLLQQTKHKLAHIIQQLGLTFDEVSIYAHALIDNLSNNVDMSDIQEQTKCNHSFLVAKILLDTVGASRNINKSNIQNVSL